MLVELACGQECISPCPPVSAASRRSRKEHRHRSLSFEPLEPLCMLTGYFIVSGGGDVVEPTEPGGLTYATVHISLQNAMSGGSAFYATTGTDPVHALAGHDST